MDGSSWLDERHEEAFEPTVGPLHDPGRAAEVLEPQARQHRAHPPAAPPLVDDIDDPRVVGLGGASEGEVVQSDAGRRGRVGGHREVHHATAPATRSWSGTSGPNVWPR